MLNRFTSHGKEYATNRRRCQPMPRITALTPERGLWLRGLIQAVRSNALNVSAAARSQPGIAAA